jgi:hypothetical protein
VINFDHELDRADSADPAETHHFGAKPSSKILWLRLHAKPTGHSQKAGFALILATAGFDACSH